MNEEYFIQAEQLHNEAMTLADNALEYLDTKKVAHFF